MLKITTIKILKRGVKHREITKITGFIPPDKTPRAYTDDYPHITIKSTWYPGNGKGWKDVPCLFYLKHNNILIERRIDKGQILLEDLWCKEILPAIKQSGNRLHHLREEEKELAKQWQGEETFCI